MLACTATPTERENHSVMTPVELPGVMAASGPNPKTNRGLFGNFKFGGHGIEVDIRPSMVDKEGKAADIFLGRHALRRWGSASSRMG